ncbi:MAG: hypothetical protein GY699_02355 [Desulfobacteraceae bacterium]|nr:hypothetical protein [Desulfobacteraceae bacterium]
MDKDPGKGGIHLKLAQVWLYSYDSRDGRRTSKISTTPSRPFIRELAHLCQKNVIIAFFCIDHY